MDLLNVVLNLYSDFPTRKALVDSLLSGCIPVTFHEYTAIRQMKWHW